MTIATAFPQGQRHLRHIIPARTVIAVAGVNALEVFDFLSFAFFATQIGANFFPAQTPYLSTLAALAAFGAGFLTRPLGAWLLGRMADHVGRRPTLILNATLMGLASAAIAVTPSYGRLGIVSSFIILASRLMQGFAIGGEIGASTAFFAEVASGRRAGALIALQNGGQEFATMVAGLTGFCLSIFLTAGNLATWGWRVPFIVGATLVPLLLLLRATMTETLPSPGEGASTPIKRAQVFRIGLLGAAALGCTSIGTYTMTYLTTYAVGTLHFAAAFGFASAIVLGFSGVVATVLAGYYADRPNARAVLLGSWIAMTIMAVPAFSMMAALRSPAILLGAAMILKLPLAITSALVLITISRALPARQRSTALGLSYAAGASVLGGSTQFVIAVLIKWTGNPLAPAFYLTVTGLIGVIIMGRVGNALASQVRAGCCYDHQASPHPK
jgi:MHS family citrate/tricarballylate:H+ symporter-like MFS transporter